MLRSLAVRVVLQRRSVSSLPVIRSLSILLRLVIMSVIFLRVMLRLLVRSLMW